MVSVEVDRGWIMKKILESLEKHKIWVETIGKRGEQLNFDEVDLRDIDLTNYPLEEAFITECNFDGMDLKGKSFYGSILGVSSFKSANLVNSFFRKAKVDAADFTGAIVRNAKFSKCECFDTIFYQTDLTNTELIDNVFVDTDFREAIWKEVDISYSWFKRVLLKGTKLIGVKGIEEALIKSINIGTPESPIILEEEEARQWILDNVTE